MAAIQCLAINLTALIQNISFVTEINFLSTLVLEIWKTAAILKSKIEYGRMGAPQFFLKMSVPQDLLFYQFDMVLS